MLDGWPPRAVVPLDCDLDPGAENQNLTWGIAQGFDVNTPGVYEVTYSATDAAGNTTTAKRTVTVGEVEDPPVITLNGRAVLKHAIGSEYVDEGASVAAADGTELDSAGLLLQVSSITQLRVPMFLPIIT